MKIPVVKEHGSWVVFILSSISAIFTGIDGSMDEIPYLKLSLTILGLAFLINSKKPLATAIKTEAERTLNICWFLFFSLCGLIMTLPFLFVRIEQFLIFIPLIIIYVILLLRGREHSLIAELIGFSLLCVSAPVIYFVLTGNFSYRLYLVVFMFFTAGVFKVRVRLKRNIQYRVMMLIYCLMVFMVFKYLDVPTIILLPIIENVLTSLWIREEKLKTTGQIELIKGIVFTLLLILLSGNSIS